MGIIGDIKFGHLQRRACSREATTTWRNCYLRVSTHQIRSPGLFFVERETRPCGIIACVFQT